MKAAILAGGMGSRIRPLSDIVPKPMIPIINKPVMEFLIELLKQHGFDQILISTAYMASHIESYFGEGSRFGVQIGYSFEGYRSGGLMQPEGLGSAGGLRKIQDFSGFFDSTFAVLCGDAIVDVNLSRAVALHLEKKALATIILKEVPPEALHRYGVVQVDDEGRILRFQEKPRPEEAVSNLANTGIYLLEPEVLELVPRNTRFDIGSQLFPLLADKGLPFYGVTLPFSWIDIGQTADYWQATQMILRGELNFIQMPGLELAPGIWGGINLDVDLENARVEGPVYIGSSTRIEPGAVIQGPTVIGRNCVIEAGARIAASVVLNYTRISGLADIAEKIVSGQFCVDNRGRTVDLVAGGYSFIVDDARERRSWTPEQEILIDFLRSEAPALE